jgi:isochorismate synthase
MEILTSVSPLKTSETELLTFLIHHAQANDLPFAIWRLPESPVKNLVISNQHQKLSQDFVLEDLNAGFVFAPFDRNKETIFLPADFLFRFENNLLKNAVDRIEISSSEWLEKEFKPVEKTKKFRFTSLNECPSTQNDEKFINLINQCIDEVEKGSMEKIVASRTKQVTLPPDFDIVHAFQKLCSRYPGALISFVNIPGVGSWLGATPEVLVSIEQKKIFKTVALAGTQPYREGMNLRAVAWTQKEIEEQALVERYIISCFKNIRLREYDEHGPKTIVAGNLIHLKSDFAVDLQATNFPHLGTVMLKLLHPTSAVCGMPLNKALEFLKTHEGYNRSYYAGYLGPVNVDNDVHIFVNLRCTQLIDDQAILYAGAGVTVDSVPEEEFEETEMKFNTLLNVIL